MTLTPATSGTAGGVEHLSDDGRDRVRREVRGARAELDVVVADDEEEASLRRVQELVEIAVDVPPPKQLPALLVLWRRPRPVGAVYVVHDEARVECGLITQQVGAAHLTRMMGREVIPLQAALFSSLNSSL
jgi:hypothetical protein